MLRVPFLRPFLRLVGVFGHDVLKVAPERLYGRELGAHLRDFFEGAVQLVDVLEDEF